MALADRAASGSRPPVGRGGQGGRVGQVGQAGGLDGAGGSDGGTDPLGATPSSRDLFCSLHSVATLRAAKATSAAHCPLPLSLRPTGVVGEAEGSLSPAAELRARRLRDT